MRRILSACVAALMVVAAAGGASAAPLKWEGTLKVELGPLPEVFATGTGVATVNGSSGFGHLDQIRLAPGLSTVATVPVTDPETTAGDGIRGVVVSIDSFTGTLGNVSGGGALSPNTMPVRGLAKICLISPVTCVPGVNALRLPLTSHTAGSSTIGFGVGGLITVGGVGTIKISITANPWTLGTGTSIDQTDNGDFVIFTSMGFAHGPASLTSSTALPSGVVKFITPLQVTTNLTSGTNAMVKLFSSLKLRFVPEPGMLLLLGSGVVGLVLLGRHRMKK
jgi:hypothetical protein